MTDEYLFISDCHLDSDNPEISNHLIRFLRERASTARYLYILGDLFEVWLGDDDTVPAHTEVINILFDLSRTTKLFFLAGNRDFLLGDKLARRAGLEIITEPVYLNLGNQRIVLLHGDILCTDDHDYQAFRKIVRTSKWKTEFLQKTLAERQKIASDLRSESAVATAQKKLEITHEGAFESGHGNSPLPVRSCSGRACVLRWPGIASTTRVGETAAKWIRRGRIIRC